MPISPSEASKALREIADTELASSSAHRYALAAPHLMLWGVIWFLGYGTTYLYPRLTGVWIPLAIAGAIGSGWVGARATSREQRYDWWQSLGTVLAILIALCSLFAVLPDLDRPRIGAFFPITIGFGYTVVGIWHRATRLLITGIALTGITLLGFFWMPSHFALWMALVGGGGLILGAVWLRKL